MKEEKEVLQEAANVLKKGGVVIYPADTIWGMGCDARNEEAVQRILQIKQRPTDKGLIVLVDGDAMLNNCVREVPSIAWDLMDVADHPLTVIYDEGVRIAPTARGTDGSVAIRVVKEGFCNRLIGRARCPLISTSVNLSGQPSATDIKGIDPAILAAVDYVVNLPTLPPLGNRPSSVIKLTAAGNVTIIRP